MHSTLFPPDSQAFTGGPDRRPFDRVWSWLLSGRIAVAIALLLLQLLDWILLPHSSFALMVICVAYVAETIVLRTRANDPPPAPQVGLQWLSTIGVDLGIVAALQWLHIGSYSFLPLLGLPVLMAGILGSRILGLSTAAAATLLMLGWSAWETTVRDSPSSSFLQAGLSGLAYFCIVLLIQQLSTRLERERRLAERSRQAALVQRQVSRVVIEQLSDGVLVVDAAGVIRMVNPAALQLMGLPAHFPDLLSLSHQPAWSPLRHLAASTFLKEHSQEADINLVAEQRSPQALHVRTWLTPLSRSESRNATTNERLCVMFLHDLRLLEARLRTEKLAAMGRMSAAVAHEIRNPLAAIVQANALLQEDLHDPTQQRLAQMVRNNAERLARTVEEILDIARVQQQIAHAPASSITLDESVNTTWQEWKEQDATRRQGTLRLGCANSMVEFDHEHLRRVMVNLLDNAQRYCASGPNGIQVVTTPLKDYQQDCLIVWSDAPPIDQSILSHLFEPFFSSESRSSGLGLYICRQLCERHGASIEYQRTPAPLPHPQATERQGNAFIIRFRPTSSQSPDTAPLFDSMLV